MTFSKDSNLYDSNAALYVFELDTQKIHRFDGYDLAGRTYVFDSGKCVFELTSAGSDNIHQQLTALQLKRQSILTLITQHFL